MPLITINNVRISYPTLFKPKQINGQGDPKYSAAFLIEPTNPKLRELVAMAKQAVAEAYPKGTPPNFKTLPLYKGSEKYPGDSRYADVYILNTSNKNRPRVVDQRKEIILDPEAVYPGMVVNVGLSVYVYGQRPGSPAKGVTTGLEGVQIVRDGERLDSRPAVDDLFEPLDVIDAPAEDAGLFEDF